jgi:hypothetical protein
MMGFDVAGDLLSGSGTIGSSSEDGRPVEIGHLCTFLNRQKQDTLHDLNFKSKNSHHG